MLTAHTYPTPLGPMTALLSGRGLCLLEFADGTKGLELERAQVEQARGGPPQPGGCSWVFSPIFFMILLT